MLDVVDSSGSIVAVVVLHFGIQWIKETLLGWHDSFVDRRCINAFEELLLHVFFERCRRKEVGDILNMRNCQIKG